MRVALLLLREARERVTARLFGVAPDQSRLVSAIAIVSIAGALRGNAARILGHRPNMTGDSLIGAGVVNVATHRIAGPQSDGTPFLAGLMALAAGASLFAPALGRSIRAARASSHSLRVALSRRYRS